MDKKYMSGSQATICITVLTISWLVNGFFNNIAQKREIERIERTYQASYKELAKTYSDITQRQTQMIEKTYQTQGDLVEGIITLSQEVANLRKELSMIACSLDENNSQR